MISLLDFLVTFQEYYFEFSPHPLFFYFFFLNGLRKIWISQKLHELGVKWGYDGWTHFHLALSGTNTQQVIDNLESILSDPTTDEDLDPPSLKRKWAAATASEAADASQKQEYNPIKEIKFVKVVDDCTPIDYRIENDFIPKVTDVIVVAPDGTKSTKVYYQCQVCSH